MRLESYMDFCYIYYNSFSQKGHVAKWLRRQSAKLLFMGSIPIVAFLGGRKFCMFYVYVYVLQSLKNTNWPYVGYADDLKG